MKRCLYCYRPLEEQMTDYHPACVTEFFGTTERPVMEYGIKDIRLLASQVIKSQFAITGAQPKLSFDIEKTKSVEVGKFTLVGLWGNYILKPQSDRYPQLPEVEDLTMHLASIAQIDVVPHSLIRMADGSLAYITKRIDRQKIRNKVIKYHMEDMCQITGRLTMDKYKGSYEQIAKAILRFSSRPMLDVVNFYEQVLFAYLTGNADMHLKNYSLWRPGNNEPNLSPAYDHVSTALVMPEDKEELALTLNGKKRRLHRSDFVSAMTNAGIESKQQSNIFERMKKAKGEWMECVEKSFLSKEYKIKYKEILGERYIQIHT